MPEDDRYQVPDLSAAEKAIVDLVRVGLAGDAGSVRQLARRLLQRRAQEQFSNGFRTALGTVVFDQGSDALRGTRSVTPVDAAGGLALVTTEEDISSEAPTLSREAEAAVARLLVERRGQKALSAAGLEPPKSLMLQGPPGVGKTLTARWLASELDLPLVSVELATLMSSLLGQTGQNLKQILDHAKSFPCVLLLDEFDALAKRRDDQSDVGELKRLVNVLLLELERWPAEGLLIAATNHPQLLDPAAARRFDVTIVLDLPEQEQRVELLRRALERYDLSGEQEFVPAYALAFAGKTGADIERDVAAAARASVLGNGAERPLAFAAAEVLRADAAHPESRAAFCALATTQLGMTQRKVADLLGVTHPTVGNLARQWLAEQGSERRSR